MDSEIRELLLGVQQGTVSVDQALLHLKQKPFEDLTARERPQSRLPASWQAFGTTVRKMC